MIESNDEKLIKTNKKEQAVVIPVSDSDITESEGQSEKSLDINQKEMSKEIDCLEQLQRLQAEFSNYKKRVEKEKEGLYELAKGDLILKLLPVLDDFHRMIDHHEKHDQIECEGIQLIFNKMKKMFKDEGLEEIQSVGEPFDPDLHEAVGIEKTHEDQENRVLEEWQKGYRFQGRLLRPSRVKVGKCVKEITEER